MRRQLPNALTLLRLLLAAVFFVVLTLYRYEPKSDPHTGVLFTALTLFILAAITDWLDGYLARRWHVESRFGRIMDPVCDKVLVIGAFICLAGPRFIIPDKPPNPLLSLNMATGIYPWMVVLILARELLVTSIRGELEGTGHKFGANLWGKLKMILQSIVIPIVLGIVWLDPMEHRWASITRDVLVYTTVAVTLVSGWPYVVAARRAMRGTKEEGA